MKYPKGFAKSTLLPAVVQDTKTKQVVMLAYMNKEAYRNTVETKTSWFWSRSRENLWNKGATSGNMQIVKSISFDCDEDTILLEVDQQGTGACHTGSFSCFSKII